MIINIFLSNKEVYQQVKDSYGWDQASAIKDQILATSKVVTDSADELKKKRELLTKGIEGLPEVKPQSLKIKFIGGALKVIGPISEVIDTGKKLDDAKTAQTHFKKSDVLFDKCMEESNDFNSKNFSNIDRCFELRENTILRFESDLYKAAGYENFDPKHIRKIKEAIKTRQSKESK